MIPWIALVVTLVPFVWMILVIEDWGRDFSQNVAFTDARAGDQRLHPVTSPLTTEQVAEQIVAWSESQSNWEYQSQEMNADGSLLLHLVRTTRMLRFKDDIRVTLRPLGSGGTVVEGESRSRVGKGDLGQNPRNLRELLGHLREVTARQ
jgi:uncharacterized protein (DUF1499 family)